MMFDRDGDAGWRRSKAPERDREQHGLEGVRAVAERVCCNLRMSCWLRDRTRAGSPALQGSAPGPRRAWAASMFCSGVLKASMMDAHHLALRLFPPPRDFPRIARIPSSVRLVSSSATSRVPAKPNSMLRRTSCLMLAPLMSRVVGALGMMTVVDAPEVLPGPLPGPHRGCSAALMLPVIGFCPGIAHLRATRRFPPRPRTLSRA